MCCRSSKRSGRRSRKPWLDPAGTLLRLGSVSKLFTRTAVMQLAEQGKLDLDADVNRYLDFQIPPRAGRPITLRNIMTHTAGFEERTKGLLRTTPATLKPLGEALALDLLESVLPGVDKPGVGRLGSCPCR